MTNQELFDRVVIHARAQKRKAEVEIDCGGGLTKKSCRYRTPDGRKCFIGALIPDEKYSQKLENHTVALQDVRNAAGITSEQVVLAENLQMLHDSEGILNWERGFRNIAKTYNLTYTPPTE